LDLWPVHRDIRRVVDYGGRQRRLHSFALGKPLRAAVGDSAHVKEVE
jgi:hypothetical protein